MKEDISTNIGVKNQLQSLCRCSDKKLEIWIKIMKLGALTGCHQMYERSFSLLGYQFPLCARCTGLAVGQFLGLICSLILIKIIMKWDLLFIFIPAFFSIILLGMDGIGQLKKKWVSTNVRRFVTGISCGFLNMVLLSKLFISLFLQIKHS